MRYVHRIGFRASPVQERQLEALGVKPDEHTALPGGGDPLITFDVRESHPKWSTLDELFKQWKVSDFLRTEFSKKEIDSAQWLEMGAWHHGYPQPDDDVFGYRQATYDLTEWCEQCGIGMKQKAPFQMKGEPKWGKNGIMQLIWVYDELFVTPDVWTAVFEPHGIGRRAVVNAKGVELRTVFQLVVEEEVGMATDALTPVRCAACGRIKHLPVTRGFFPALKSQPTKSIAKTIEYFGSGAAATKRVVIAQHMYRDLAENMVRGATVMPVSFAQ